MLVDALSKLMQQKSFDNISINELCKAAMVHRATFYNHFVDKYVLLNFAIDSLIEELFSSIVENEKYDSIKQIALAITSKAIDFVNTYSKSIISIFNSSSDIMTKILHANLNRMISYIISKNKKFFEFSVPSEILISFFAGGITSTSLAMLSSTKKYTKEEILLHTSTLIADNLAIKK